MADEFDQYKRSAGGDDEFAQYKRAPENERSEANVAGGTSGLLQRAGLPTASDIGHSLLEVGKGAVKGLAHTLSGGGDIRLLPSTVPGIGGYQPLRPIPHSAETMIPRNPAQKAGYAGEQIGEWLIPSGAEEKAASMVPRIARPLTRIGVGSLESGLRNKSQGGDFATGAKVGAGAGVLGEGMRAIAPKLAESALGVTNKMRGHGRTIGEAALNEVSGVRPSTIAKQAGKKLGSLTGELETKAGAAAGPASTQPALSVIDNAIAKFSKRNSGPIVDKLKQVRGQLTHDLATGNPLGTSVSPEKILDLKRGIGDLVGSWSVQEKRGVQAVLPQIYRALDSELDRTVAGSEGLNQRISSLIPVKQRAEKIETLAPLSQRIAHRIGAHTGALAGAGIGGGIGYHRGGVPGALIGGTAGLALPEILASPTTQMRIARTANSPGTALGFGKGAGLQFNRRSMGDVKTDDEEHDRK